jgi:TonB family protein
MSAANALAWFAQIAVVVAGAAALPRLADLRSVTLQHVYWRAVLALCLLLPVAERWRPHQMTLVALGSAPVVTLASASTAVRITAPAPVDWTTVAVMVLAAGVVLRLAWIGGGLVRLRRLRRGSGEPADGFDDLRQAVGVGDVPILWSPDAAHPVTFGVLRPIVLLPSTVRTADRAAQRAVVAHELHHVKRRDWLATVAEEIVRAVFWFHPAMWWLISRTQLAREAVVDELAILTTNERRAYLDTLLAFADDSGLQPSSTAFSARRHLFHRVMLLAKEGSMSSIRLAAASCVVAVGLGASSWGAVRAFPLHQAAQKPAAPPRDARTPADYHRLAVELWEKANQDTTLTQEEKLETVLKGIAAEDRGLAINPDYVPALTYKNLFLRMQADLTPDQDARDRLFRQANELREKAIALGGLDRLAPPPPPPPPPPQAEMSFMPESFERHLNDLNPIRIGGNIRQPAKISDVKPIYPPLALKANVRGTVLIEALIDRDGAVADARILRSIPLLDQAALDAVQQWRFTPTLLNGEPQAVVMTVAVNFAQP